MKSRTLGANTSEAEVTNIDTHGIWVYVKSKEHFLPYEDYPWFKDAKVKDIINVELHFGVHLHWPALDVDLFVDSLEHPGQYPLVAEGSNNPLARDA
ncbi:MAG: DUF2442 domain-containing protein [Kiritimatiellae bacterium]|nr:DUF2442 domain-containing protein [Kiritimatiellia bacterium]